MKEEIEMKKLLISALCGLFLFSAFAGAAAKPANGAADDTAISRRRIYVRC